MGDVVYGVDVSSLEETVVKGLIDKGLTISTAESCTGGLIGKRITDISGCSGCYFGGVVSYSNDVKHKVLGVGEKTLRDFGAVSPETAIEMARGVRKLTGSDIGISVTGVAGPGGGSEEKPVGTVYIGISVQDVYKRQEQAQAPQAGGGACCIGLGRSPHADPVRVKAQGLYTRIDYCLL